MGEIEVTTCPRLGAHEAVMMVPRSYTPIAQVRLEDGSQVVAYEPAGLEVRAFTAEDLDERGMPRGKP
jgi:hypothetical protein